MKKIDFNDNWKYRHLDIEEELTSITIPHDAMITEKRTADSLGGNNTGWFEGYDYLYVKKFFAPMEWCDLHSILEFEGVYHNAEVYINGEKVAFRPYGYTNFYVETEGFLKYGEENEIQVIARNADQPNSRWYSGAGIYRPVWLHQAPKNHIEINGVKISTVSATPAVVRVSVATTGAGDLLVSILDGEKEVALAHQHVDEKITTMDIKIPQATLWSPNEPHCYTCKVAFEDDEAIETFGIRSVQWDRENGLTINEERVIIRGACIHHDNGLLGACAFPEAEERKIRILKENGYNAIRSAHNPCSKAMLDACDRLGMLVLDEYLDVWYIHKTQYDYAVYMQDWWKQDLKDMVEKDYNHPSVIMYSTGNEVSETAQKRGIELTKAMTEYLHSLDDSRPVTCGINIFFNFLSSIGLGVYSDEKSKKEVEQKPTKKKKAVGSEFYNNLAGLLGADFMKIGATLHACDVKTRDAFAAMDIAGYNYGIRRYKHDLKKYPNRLILGSETFCSDAYKFYEMAKEMPGIIGDFVWAGMDYMGEAGVGAWEYEDYAPKNGPQEGWLTAGSGRINILGRPNGEALYTKVAFEQTAEPHIVVKPVYQTGKHSPSAWKMTDALPNWTYPGCEGQKATIEVYTRAYEVELQLNGKCVGKKKRKKDCRVGFKVAYQPGTLTAICYDRNGNVVGQKMLETAGMDLKITLMPEEKAQQGKLLYVPIAYTDSKAILKPMQKGDLTIQVKGGELLGFGNACCYNLEGYKNNHTKTYMGEAMAILRVDQDAKELTITVSDGALEETFTTTCIQCD